MSRGSVAISLQRGKRGRLRNQFFSWCGAGMKKTWGRHFHSTNSSIIHSHIKWSLHIFGSSGEYSFIHRNVAQLENIKNIVTENLFWRTLNLVSCCFGPKLVRVVHRLERNRLKMMKSYVPRAPEAKDVEAQEPVSKEKLPISEICQSSALDAFLESPKIGLTIKYPLPRCEGADFVSEKTTGSDLPPELQVGTSWLLIRNTRLMTQVFWYEL